MTYKVSDTPIGDETKWGCLAYVGDRIRKKIIESGYGEMQLHVAHIKRSIGYIQ